MANDKSIRLIRVKCPTCKLNLLIKPSVKFCPACRGPTYAPANLPSRSGKCAPGPGHLFQSY